MMGILRTALGQTAGIVLGLGLGALLFLGGFLVARSTTETGSAQVGGDTLAACVSSYSGEARFMYPGQPAACNAGEFAIELGSGAAVADLTARLGALEGQVPACLADEEGDAIFTGCDVEIRNGMGETDTQNGTGNLIVGYNESFGENVRNGSHNIVVGINHSYESYGGLVAGAGNIISGEYASVSGGSSNEASGEAASVSGGSFNDATGFRASVSGGDGNTATGPHSSVLGGQGNIAGGEIFGGTTVSGGQVNTASGTFSSISGGWGNETTEFAASISGGLDGTASEQYASVSGGQDNVASASVSTVGGGVGLNADEAGEFLPSP